MKNDDQEAADLLRQMGRVAVPLLAPENEARRHERMTLSVNRLVRGLRPPPPLWRERPAVRALGAFAATAACLALAFAAYRFVRASRNTPTQEVAQVISVRGESTLWRFGSSESVLVAGQRVDPAVELRSSARAQAELVLTGAGRARVEVSEETRVRLNQRLIGSDGINEDWLDLEQGLIALQVEKLPPGLGLSVQTPDARVTVHGTRFSVRVTPRVPAGTLTFVAVTEGRVEVESRNRVVFLGPGEQWSSQTAGPESENMPVVPQPPEAPAGVVQSGVVPAANHPISTAAARANESTLADENRIYAHALARARAGDLQPALADLATLIRTYPRSPLAQHARVDRFRFLQQSGSRSAAAAEARRYLSEYPSGFARAEARRLAVLGLEAPE